MTTRDALRLTRFHRVGAAVHAVALSDDGEHALIGSERDLRLIDSAGRVRFRLDRDGEAFSAVALAPGMASGLAMERGGRLHRLDFERQEPRGRGGPRGGDLRVAATGIWEQRDDVYSLDFTSAGHEGGLVALGHHGRGLSALDLHGRLLWQLGPGKELGTDTRTWVAALSAEGRTIYASPLGGRPLGGVLRDRGGARGEAKHAILAIDAAIGKPVRTAPVEAPVTLLAALPQPLAVAAVHRCEARWGDGAGEPGDATGGPRCIIAAYDADLKRAWQLSCPPGVIVTAAAAMPGKAALLLGTNTGELWRVGAFTGRMQARYDLLFPSTVLALAVAAAPECGCSAVAAGLANGHVALLEQVTHER